MGMILCVYFMQPSSKLLQLILSTYINTRTKNLNSSVNSNQDYSDLLLILLLKIIQIRMNRVRSACYLHSPDQKLYHNRIEKCGCHASQSKLNKKARGAKSGECCGHHHCHALTNKHMENKRVGTDGQKIERVRSSQQVIMKAEPSEHKNQKKQQEQDPDLQRLRDIIEKNAAYFQQRTKVCCDVKPNKHHRLELPSKTGHTTYQHDYTKKNPEEDELDLRKVQSYKMIYQFYDQTNYQINYVQHPPQTRQIHKKQPEGLNYDKSPRFLQTQYKDDYRNWKGKATASIIEPPHSHLMGNIPFEGKTVYMADFVPKKQPIEHFHHSYSHQHIFPNIKFQNRSVYQDEFIKKKMNKDRNIKPKDEIIRTGQQEGQYNTEYNDQYYKKHAQHCQYRKVLTLQQIQRLMNNL